MATLKVTKKHHRRINNPFPSTPKTLSSTYGQLLFNPQTIPEHSQLFSIGHDFRLLWSPTSGGCFGIFHKSDLKRSIWSTIPGHAFVSAAAVDTEVEESRGSFAFNDRKALSACNHQMVEDIRETNSLDHCQEAEDQGFRGSNLHQILESPSKPVLVVSGLIFSGKKTEKNSQMHRIRGSLLEVEKVSSASAKYWVLFYQKNAHQVGFQVKLGKPNFTSPRYHPRQGLLRAFMGKKFVRLGKLRKSRKIKPRLFGLISRHKGFTDVSTIDGDPEEQEAAKFLHLNRICFSYASQVSERFYGFGEQFSYMDFKGKRVPILVQEQGIGRGDQPITSAINFLSYRAGGDWSSTYAPSPFYMTSKMRSLYLEGYDYSVFDLTVQDRVQIQVHGSSIQGVILYGNSPTDLIEAVTETIGRPPELPQWIISGAVVGMQGGTEAVRHTWDTLQAYDVPISSFWLQDWVGSRETIIGSQLWWNWEVDTTKYRGWKQLLEDLNSQNVNVMTYCNPCLAPAEEKPNRRRNLFEEAKKLDILVKDKNGEPYMVPNTAFDVGMLDLTHPDTSPWFKKVLEGMVCDGVKGWMADFGEGLPVDAVLHSGEDPVTAHNRYPELWAQINREFVEEWKESCTGTKTEDREESLVFFIRAGFRESCKWAMLFWEGDQMVSWQKNDGIKSAAVGLLSSGLSGFALNHSDTGGYCTVNIPLIGYYRSEELLFRWMELSAFTTVFRTHEGNKPSCNSQVYSNHQTLSHFARYAKIYKAWKFYRIQLVKEAAKKGLPVCRHLFIHYPEDEHVQKLTYQQFLVGTEILVVPVLDKGKKKVEAYFPAGRSCTWKHIWTGELYKEEGFLARVEAPIGYPAVFVKSGSIVGETFLQNLKDLCIQ